MKTIVIMYKSTHSIMHYIFSLTIVGCLLLLMACGSDDLSATQVATKKITANTWKISTVTVDGTDRTNLFDNMTLTFTKTNYTTTSGGVVWPTSGTWEFIDNNANAIIRNDDLEIEITEVTSTSLVLSFNWIRNTFEPGRIGSVAGNHVFTFVKN